MKKGLKRTSLILVMVLLLSLTSGCEKENLDPHETEVMQLLLTPVPTPTEAPKYVNPDAVITQGAIKYINGYINDGSYVPPKTAEESSEESQDYTEDSESYDEYE